MTHPVKLDELLERFEFVPHEGSPHHWLCLTHGDPVPILGDHLYELGLTCCQATRDRWMRARDAWLVATP